MSTLMETLTPPAAPAPETAPDVSVIVAVSERAAPLEKLYEEYAAPLRASKWKQYEFIFVVEPRLRHLAGPLAALAARHEPLRVLSVGQPIGESSLLKLAAAHCRAPIVVTLPAYQRIQAAALPHLITRLDAGTDLLVVRRWPRRDSWINQIQNRLFHALVHPLTGGRLHDLGCGVRVLRRHVLEEISLYGDFFRFLPVLALRDGYRIEEASAPQHEQDGKTRIYGPGTYLRRLIDLLGLFFLIRFTDKPLRFFGLMGSLLAISGSVLLTTLLVQRLGGQGIADRPLLLLGVLLLVLGVQAIALGLVGEIIVHLHAPHRSPYRLASSGSSDP